MTSFEMLKISARSTISARMTVSEIARMLAYGVLAVQAARSQDGNAFTYKMHVGSMRGTFRRAARRTLARA